MRVLYLYAHPLPESFHGAIHEQVKAGLAEAGHEVDVCDLYAEGFNPVLSPGMRYGNLVFTAGQVAVDPATGKMVEGGIKEQAHQTLKNVKAVLEAAGTSMEHVLKAQCFIADLNEDEQASLIALAWIGRGDYAGPEFEEARTLAKERNITLEN